MANHYYSKYGSSNILFPFHHQCNDSSVNVTTCINKWRTDIAQDKMHLCR
jgi:hypothetical protein